MLYSSLNRCFTPDIQCWQILECKPDVGVELQQGCHIYTRTTHSSSSIVDLRLFQLSKGFRKIIHSVQRIVTLVNTCARAIAQGPSIFSACQ